MTNSVSLETYTCKGHCKKESEKIVGKRDAKKPNSQGEKGGITSVALAT